MLRSVQRLAQPVRLTGEEVTKALSKLSPSWRAAPAGSPERLERVFQFRSFGAAFGFMSRVAIAADKADHHPNWSNVYSTVDVKLWTHDAQGLTQKDFALAAVMDEAATDAGCALSAAPAPRWGHTVAGYDTELVVFGGIAAEESALLSDDGSRGPVQPPFLPGTRRCPMGSVLMSSRLALTAGRFSHSGSPSNSLHKLQTQSLKWEARLSGTSFLRGFVGAEQAVSAGGTPPSARSFHSACVANDVYVVFGGNSAVDYSEPLNDIHLLDLRSSSWTTPQVFGEAPAPRFGHKMIHGPDNQIFVFGGSTSASGAPVQPGSLHAFQLATSTWITVQVTSRFCFPEGSGAAVVASMGLFEGNLSGLTMRDAE
eukprot:s1201_g3.t1